MLQDAWSEVHERLLVGFILLSTDHEEFKRVTMNESFPSTQVLIQSVQRQVQTLFERIDTYMMQVLQDWKTFRWSRITLLDDPAAKLIRMKFHVFSDCTFVRLRSRIQIHPMIGKQRRRTHGTNMDLSEHSIWLPEKCKSSGTYYVVPLLLTSKDICRFT